jgi:outer membrane protein assembly factor BamB
MPRLTRTSGWLLAVACILSSARTAISAEDWPEWRGTGRRGVWNESGILDRFPAEGLKVAWRAPLHGGFAGPAVAAGRVYVTDFKRAAGKRGSERALSLDEKSGKLLWALEWDADYQGMSYDTGPRATPTVDGDRVYVVGATGILLCLDARTGSVVWRKDYVKDYGMRLPTWGVSSAPLVDGSRLIAIVGGQPDALVVAFDKMTGKEVWRALPTETEQGYSQPVLVESGGSRQLVVWHPTAIVALDPATGAMNWEQRFRIHLGVTLSTPVWSGSRLLVSSFYNGSMLLDLARGAAAVLWKGKSNSETDTDTLHAVVNTPVIAGDYVYGICSYGQFRCLNARTGERVWETMDVTREKARWASGFIVRQGERYFINNDRGELIIAGLSEKGYREIGRTQLIKPTTNPGNRRELGVVNWTHPAYANRHVITRNDEEIVSASLAK